ncbi:hypothetical protein FOL47_010741 [Perkinsus chesapeaki]|uniref:Palmitoyltransferase n=1 Tax=Perkinsus chesapeaki TaxID=330153 RepID=A0A7J6MQ06_PERCH|nr:hypothetical protein FOL47_010741 [Perkinsus chesapeaki]
MYADLFFILKLRYAGESLRSRCPFSSITTIADIYSLIEEAWPALKTAKYTVRVHEGRDLATYDKNAATSALVNSDCGVMVAGSPREVRMDIQGGPDVTPIKNRSSSPPKPMDGHEVAVLHLNTCHHCGMGPIIGRCYKCSTCSDFTFCSRCYGRHDPSHTLTVVSTALDGMWDSREVVAVCKDFLNLVRNMGEPWPGDLVKIKDLQLPDQNVPLMIGETFPKADPPSREVQPGLCKDGCSFISYRIFCHCCSSAVSRARQLRCDGRADINLCDSCYLTHRTVALKLANKCSRIVTPSLWNDGNDEAVELVHYGSTCDECGVSPIVGRRYKCNYCAEYELCNRCFKEPANKQHRLEHLFTLIVRPAKLWTVHTKDQTGTLFSEMPCEMCGIHPPGGARYTIKCDCKAQMCYDCYKDDLQGQAVLLRGEFFDYPNPVSMQASMDRERQRLILKNSFASNLPIGLMMDSTKGKSNKEGAPKGRCPLAYTVLALITIHPRRSIKQASSVRMEWAYGLLASITAFTLTFLVYNVYFVMDHRQQVLGGTAGVWGLREWMLAMAFDVPWLLCLICYLRVLMTKPGKVPRRWTEYVTKNSIRVSVTEQSTFQPRASSICGACMRHRPERAHHCTVCACIGFRNHKFYVLFLFYGALASTVFLLLIVPHLSIRMMSSGPQASFLPLSSAACRTIEASIAMVAFLALPYFYFNLPLQCSQLCRNVTAHEAEYVATNPYDLGTRVANAAAVFGTSFGPMFLYWLLPVDPCRPESDGLFYPVASSPGMSTACSVEDGGGMEHSIQALLGRARGDTKHIDRCFGGFMTASRLLDPDMKHLITSGKRNSLAAIEFHEDAADETTRLAPPSRSSSYCSTSCIL